MQQNSIGARPDQTRAGKCLASKWLSRKLLRSKQGRRDERAYTVPATAGDERQRCTPATVPPSRRFRSQRGVADPRTLHTAEHALHSDCASPHMHTQARAQCVVSQRDPKRPEQTRSSAVHPKELGAARPL